MQNLNYDLKKAQRFCDKNRVIIFKNNVSKKLENTLNIEEINLTDIEICKKNSIICGEYYLLIYECVSNNLKPIFENEYFAIFNKPSGVLSHPNGRNCEYSLNDEIWQKYGENASVAHRLDAATSGLIMVAKTKTANKELKELFAKQKIHKEYLALVCGNIKNDFCVSARLKNDDDLKNKMQVCVDGKISQSEFIVIKNYPKYTLLKAIPLTGRQHQLRVHLHYVGNKIAGDNLYGLTNKQARDILDKKISNIKELCGASRLCLHSARLKFTYKNQDYDFFNDDIENEFLGAIK
ncbi:RNA pseudouridine synthase [Campylobacter sp. RM12640]|uniref:RluA family pseudouridine synthase n=1 Tax=unclassified Campylobacter TaxID=2593542 RepID=UPI001BDABA08|nr:MULTISPECIES: RNA pseudouridine synthase [unclassified Campylobacter]MBT0883464.1 RNA pseudouridine synthase [Campylobacter sp. 2018MI13]MBZ7982242.1 RNA pseudouridine synthase [Campylobacter sp. RM12640]MBZ7989423.1 RNA pseudouridine synthase [Campylobacter sp. RM12635]